MNESRLLYEIMREVGKHAVVYRCNAGSVKLPNGKRFTAMPRGFSDIMAILPGGCVAFVEVKTPRGKSTAEQETFISKMRMLGCRAGVARSVSDALRICGIEQPA